MNDAQYDLAEELAAWLGPVLAEVGLVAASDDERVEELADLLATEARFVPRRAVQVFSGAPHFLKHGSGECYCGAAHIWVEP